MPSRGWKIAIQEDLKRQYMKQWGSFLSSGENKIELIRFLVSRWNSDYSINEMEVDVAHDTFCVNL